MIPTSIRTVIWSVYCTAKHTKQEQILKMLTTVKLFPSPIQTLTRGVRYFVWSTLTHWSFIPTLFAVANDNTQIQTWCHSTKSLKVAPHKCSLSFIAFQGLNHSTFITTHAQSEWRGRLVVRMQNCPFKGPRFKPTCTPKSPHPYICSSNCTEHI